MHTHNTLPNMSQKYKKPIWEVPDCPNLSKEDRGTIAPNAKSVYYPAKDNYKAFAEAFLARIATLDE